ncbi:MAG: Crp/Fnr family transcriptional regulator [Cyclobacteriaceae bacterium]
MEDKIWYLAQINILKDLSKDQLMALGSQCGMQTLQRGENLYLPGDTNDIYFLKKGSVKLISNSSDGEELIHEIIHVGEIFGKLHTDNVSSGIESAVAMDEVIVCFLSVDKWQSYVAQNISLNIKVLKWMGLKIRKVERKMDMLYFKDARTRVIELLTDLAHQIGKPKEADVVLKIRLTHEEIAQLTGNSRQSVTTLMNTLREEGLIDYDRNRITIKAPLISDFTK